MFEYDPYYDNDNMFGDFSFDETTKTPAVIAFLSNIDTRANDGHLYFRETMDQDILDRATRDMEDGTGFIATWVFIATWHEVTYYLGNTTSPVSIAMLVNTSQP